MANYPKELIDLLNQYLTDGVMTSKEREVLLRKAEAMNVDKDEFDLFIDAEVQKIDQKADAIKRQSKGKLCPFCDASIPMFTDKCPECGGNITPQATKEAEDIINCLETALQSFSVIGDKKREQSRFSLNFLIKAYFIIPLFFNNSAKQTQEEYIRLKSEVERYIRKAKMYYGNNKAINFLIESVNEEVAKIEKSIATAKRNKRLIILSVVGGYLLLYVLMMIIAFATY